MKYLSIAQIIISLALIMLILMQERSSGLSGIFGGSESEVYQKRRGLEKTIFWATVVLIVALGASSLVSLALQS